jgi:hypothetical protein
MASSADRWPSGALVEGRVRSGSGEIDYTNTSGTRVRFLFNGLSAGGSNQGAGGIVIPEASEAYALRELDLRVNLTKPFEKFLYQGGLEAKDKRWSSEANSKSAGLTVSGDLVAGGAPVTSNETDRTSWTWKNVFQSNSPRPSWTVGITIAGSYDLDQQVPNAAGSYQFDNVSAYTAALAGQGTGTWFITRGNGTARYLDFNAAPFFQKVLFRSDRALVTGGIRADYQLGYRTLISPRLSAAYRFRGFVMRTGSGVFVHNIPSSVFVREIENDGNHLQQYILDNVSPIWNPTVPLAADSTGEVHSQLVPDLTRPREFMWKASLERNLHNLTPGLEYTWTRERHLLGARRLPDENGWLDLIESNRNADVQRLHARLNYKWKAQNFYANYERIRSFDDGSGLFSFPADQNNLRAEWARSAGVSPDNISLAGIFSLPAGVNLTLTETWRDSAPYNITTGLDPSNDGLYTDRGGRPRNSANGPGYSSLAFYASRRIVIPAAVTRSRKPLHFTLGLQGDNLLDNKNYGSIGSVLGSATFGQPLSALPSRSIRFWINFN